METIQNKNLKLLLNIVAYIFLTFTIICLILPYLSMLGTAIKTNESAMSTISLLPTRWEDFSLESFGFVISETNFPRNVWNSIVVGIVVTAVCSFCASLAGYAISRYKGPYFRIYSILLLLLQMFPVMLLLMPLYITYTNLKLINTLWSVIISYTTMNLSFGTWMLKGFFDTIPRELEGAAVVDGCTRFEAFLRVIMPLALPGIATVAIFTVLGSWNEYTLASIFLRRDAVLTMTVGLQKFVMQNESDWPHLMAAATLATIPTVLFVLFAQKYLIEGMTAGAVKG